MIGFELGTSGVGSERSTNWATTIDVVSSSITFVGWNSEKKYLSMICPTKFFLNSQRTTNLIDLDQQK